MTFLTDLQRKLRMVAAEEILLADTRRSLYREEEQIVWWEWVMESYHSVIGPSKAPRKPCIAFDKLDGTNIGVKYTPKNGFYTFGTKTHLVDESTPFWNRAIPAFRRDAEEALLGIFKTKQFRDYQEITVFGEFVGPNSFAGSHDENEQQSWVLIDVLLGHKERKLVRPQDFVKTFTGELPLPRVVYEGNLNDSFIQDVRNGDYGVNEGVICKGIEKTGAFWGHTWMCKVKTLDYLARIKKLYGADYERYWE